MKRRKFIAALGAGGVITAGGLATWFSIDHEHPHLAIDAAIKELTSLDLESIRHTGDWEIARIFGHLRQGIEFSINGYPDEKSPLFQNSVGKLAFNVFHSRGEMSHALNEIIPGETPVKGDLVAALRERDALVKSLTDFQDFGGELKPHFAYGLLDKDEYARAHVMHVNNHLIELDKS